MTDHCIHRTRFDFSFTNQQQALAMQQQLPDFINQQLLPEMEKLFSTLVSEEQFLQIDQLEIDLGVLSFEKLQSTVLESVDSQLKVQLEQAVQQLATQQLYISQKENTPTDSIQHETAKTKENAIWQDLPALQKNALIYFLETGLMPWWNNQVKPADLLKEILTNAPQILLDFLENKATTHVVNRLVKQFSKKDFERILTLKNAKKSVIFQQVIFNYKKLTINKLSDFYLKKEAFNFCFKNDHSLDRVLHHILTQEVLDWKRQNSTMSIDQWTNTLLKKCQQLPIENERKMWTAAITAVGKKEAGLKEINTDFSVKNETSQVDIALEQGVLLPHAGLVILNPFLPRFFKNIGLVENRQFKSIADQEKAVLLTIFLATGQKDIAEQKAVLAKLLCGFPMEHPLEKTLTITPKEAAAVTELLESAIQHWSAIGKTSPDGLRRAFLQRTGRLQKKESNYYLKIERKGHDVLLEKLPWNIGFIRLPWMKLPLEVEW